MPSTEHQYRKALLDGQQTNISDIKHYKSRPISTNYGCSQSEKLPSNNHRETDFSSEVNYNNNNNNNKIYLVNCSTSPQKMNDKFNVKYIGTGLFVCASLFCLYYIWTVPSEPKPNKYVIPKLKLVSVFNRHGDRAPSDGLPKGDRHAEKVDLFWPNGLHNLTDTGRFRQFRIGLDLRRRYNDLLGLNSSNVIAFSSPVFRCIESLENTLRGLYNTEWTKDKGRLILIKDNCTENCLSSGSGSPDEWRRIPIDLKTVPALVYQYLNNCTYRKEHPSPLDTDLTLDPEIKALPGVEQLKKLLKEKYDQDFNFPVLGLWSTIASEMNLMRTESTIQYTSHYADWVNKPISSSTKRNSVPITMFDLHEQLAVLAYRDRVVDEARYIQMSPIITSLIESQLIALGHNSTNERMKIYKDKKMVFYSSHDSILQLFLDSLGLIKIEGSFQNRFDKWNKWDKSHDEVGKFLAGLKMSSYGMSARLELWEMEVPGKADRFSYIRAYLYNKEDAKYEPIEYKPIEIGSACRRLFERQNPNASSKELTRFYNPVFQIDINYSCPFGLLRNVTANLLFDERKIHNLCGY